MNGSEVNTFEQVSRVDHQMVLAEDCDRGSTGKLGLGWGLGRKSEVPCPEGGWGQGVLYNEVQCIMGDCIPVDRQTDRHM